MLILYSDLFLDASIGIFMRYPCLKIMSVFHITLSRPVYEAAYFNLEYTNKKNRINIIKLHNYDVS